MLGQICAINISSCETSTRSLNAVGRNGSFIASLQNVNDFRNIIKKCEQTELGGQNNIQTRASDWALDLMPDNVMDCH